MHDWTLFGAAKATPAMKSESFIFENIILINSKLSGIYFKQQVQNSHEGWHKMKSLYYFKITKVNQLMHLTIQST